MSSIRTSIRAYAQIIQARLDELGLTEESQLQQSLNRQLGRLSALVRDLLDTSRISEGKMKYRFESSNISEVINKCVDGVSRTVNNTFRVSTEGLPSVLADRERIGQVLTNLLTNAVKYSPSRSTVSVSA